MARRLYKLMVVVAVLAILACSRAHQGADRRAASPGMTGNDDTDTAPDDGDDESEPGTDTDPDAATESTDATLDAGESDQDARVELDAAAPRIPATPGEEPYQTNWSGGGCAQVTATINGEPTHLAIVLDGSNRLRGDTLSYHDAKLKWDPVLAALRGFFMSEAQNRTSISITLFPSVDMEMCSETSYREPDLTMTPLPSPVPAKVLGELAAKQVVVDLVQQAPIAASLRATRAYLGEYLNTHAGLAAIVLITDDEIVPGCALGDGDAAASAIEELANATEADVPISVIALKDPPNENIQSSAPALAEIARAASGQMRLIEIGDPNQTTAKVAEALTELRDDASSCVIRLLPQLLAFPRSSQTLRVTSGHARTPLVYDPSCTQPNGWHFESLDTRQAIIPCPQTCQALRSEPGGSSLSVNFACIELKVN